MSDKRFNKVKKDKNKGGRPTKLTKDIQDQICTAIKIGAYVETAAVHAGVSKVTFYSWLKKGHKQNTGMYRKFLNAVKKAMADAELIDLKNIHKAAEKQWQASAWRLERKFPDKWGRQRSLDEDSPMNYKEPEFLKDDELNSDLAAEAGEALETD